MNAAGRTAELVSDDLWEIVAPLLPPEPFSKKHEGGRSRLSDRTVLIGIVYVLKRLGRWHWVVERTFSWMASCRRLVVRYERRADIHEAFLLLACSLTCFRRLQGRF